MAPVFVYVRTLSTLRKKLNSRIHSGYFLSLRMTHKCYCIIAKVNVQ